MEPVSAAAEDAKPGMCEAGRAVVLMLQAPLLALERERVSDGYGTTGQPLHALTQAPFVAKNALYYDSSERAAAALTDAEKAQLVQARRPASSQRPSTRLSHSGAPVCSCAEKALLVQVRSRASSQVSSSLL